MTDDTFNMERTHLQRAAGHIDIEVERPQPSRSPRERAAEKSISAAWVFLFISAVYLILAFAMPTWFGVYLAMAGLFFGGAVVFGTKGVRRRDQSKQ